MRSGASEKLAQRGGDQIRMSYHIPLIDFDDRVHGQFRPYFAPCGHRIVPIHTMLLEAHVREFSNARGDVFDPASLHKYGPAAFP
jgi:hypothetical protein